MDLQALEEIGLTTGEAKVYLALIKLGPATTGLLAVESGVSRSKIYQILERLMRKGLVSYIVKQKTKHYQAEDPAKIREYLDQREEEFKKQRKIVDELIPELESRKASVKNESEAQIYKGFKSIQTVHEHMYSKLKRGDDFYYLGIPAYQEEAYHHYWQRDHRRREKAGIVSRALFNQQAEPKILRNRNSYKHSEARYLPIPIETPSWILGYKNVTVIGLQSDEIAVEIVNQKIADSFRRYFEAFWHLSKPFR